MNGNIFITGTDTDVGKTTVCAWLMSQTDFNYWKPIQTGANLDSDTLSVKELSGCENARLKAPTYLFSEPLSPHEAAARDDRVIELDNLISSKQSNMIIEGAGGILVPVNDKCFMIDVCRLLADKVIVVARGTLGTINHTLLTLNLLEKLGLPTGVIVTGEFRQENINSIEQFSNSKVLGVLPQIERIDQGTLRSVPLGDELDKFLYEN